ncbi:ribonuclease H-like domain-containing protein [Mycena galericulata]|nr:ribonuclease H-like domain-containing protein [Mycena galericulata]
MMSDVADESQWDVVHSDGACKGNGQARPVAGVGVFWGPDDPRNIAERCPGDQTNNRAELIAILRVLETTPHSQRPLLIKTDSKYCIQCFQDWLPNWIRNNFVTADKQPVKNASLIRYLAAQLEARARRGQKVQLQYVKGHSGHQGNDGADAQANLGALQPPEAERDWARLEADLRQRLEIELSASHNKPEPVLLEVGNQQDGFVKRDLGESPTKLRKTMASTSTEPTRPAAPPVPLYLTPRDVVQSSSKQIAQVNPEDLEQYADGLLDDDDLLAELSD